MIINLKKSILFTLDPDIRFSREYRVDRGIWALLYRRHKLLQYTTSELLELFQIKTGKELTPKAIQRWVWRSDVYSVARTALDKGAHTVVSGYFGEMEFDVIKELTKNIRTSVKKNTKTLV